MPDDTGIVTKDFPTGDVLGAITGVLLGKIDGVYAVYNWATGESVDTHQLQRIGHELQTAMVAARPELAAAVDEARQVSRESWRNQLARWVGRYGPTIAVPKLTTDQHERIDPLSELAESCRPIGSWR